MLELQVSLILLAFGIMTLSSLMMRQSRVMNRVRGDFKGGSTLYLTPSPDPWVRELGVAALVTPGEITVVAPTATNNPQYDVGLVSKQMGLTDESITVTVDLTPAN
jgi:hypothetical protein